MNVQLMLAVLFSIVTASNIAWSAPVTAYVAEFNVSGSSKPEEMKTTIQALLLSRLAGDKIMTVSKPESAEIKISGSYLLSGNVFSLDAAAVNNSGSLITRAFAQGKSPDDLIPAIGTLAKSLSEGIEKGITLAVAITKDTALPTDIVKSTRTTPTAAQVIQKMDGAMRGLAVGRTFPGGERELFVVGYHTLRYYLQGSELKLLAEIPYKVYENVIAVDTADLDNNKIPEIYVTVMDGEKLVSQVWTVEGTSLKQISGPLPYFFRAVTGAGGTKKLYAQQISGTDDYYGDVSEVVKSGAGYQLANPIKLPKRANLYNFSLLTGLKGESNPVIVDSSGHLRVFTATDDEVWKSSEEYSGSETYFKRTDRSSESGYRQIFMDQRIVVKANGELLIPKNTGSWFLLNKHSYSQNTLHCFSWNGSDLEEKWHTKQSDHYLADFAYDDNARELLMLEVVSKEEGAFDKGASRLVIRKVE